MSDAKAPTPPANGDILGKPRNWIPVALVMKVVNAALNTHALLENNEDKKPRWSWIWNTRCKYINLRIDMRDGHCLIFDKDNNPITLEQLEYQIEGRNEYVRG